MLGVVRYCNSSSLADLGMVARTFAAFPRWIAMLILSRRNDVALESPDWGLVVGLPVP